MYSPLLFSFIGLQVLSKVKEHVLNTIRFTCAHYDAYSGVVAPLQIAEKL